MRGPHSIRVSWTNGHVPWRTILASATNSSAVANGQADFAADLAIDACGLNDVQNVFRFHAVKQGSYLKLIIKLQAYAGALFAKHRELCLDIDADPQGKKAPPTIIHDKHLSESLRTMSL